MGIVGVLSPGALLRFNKLWRSAAALYLAGIIRVVFGGALLLAAPYSDFPQFLQIFGVLSILTALSLPVMGVDRARRFLDWWTDRSPNFVRLWSLLAVVMGAFLLVAVL